MFYTYVLQSKREALSQISFEAFPISYGVIIAFILFVLFIIGYAIFFALNVWHLKKYSLASDPSINKIILFFSVASLVIIIVSFVVFFAIPWKDLINLNNKKDVNNFSERLSEKF